MTTDVNIKRDRKGKVSFTVSQDMIDEDPKRVLESFRDLIDELGTREVRVPLNFISDREFNKLNSKIKTMKSKKYISSYYFDVEFTARGAVGYAYLCYNLI